MHLSLSYTMLVHMYAAIMHECQRVHYCTFTCTKHGITDLYHSNQPISSYSCSHEILDTFKWYINLSILLKLYNLCKRFVIFRGLQILHIYCDSEDRISFPFFFHNSHILL